ncbi:anthranilate phosphoribosyltransferase/anthranilate synthase/phosphoribosyltransferase [Terribacillus aidingensis]|uniref:Anthranilate phosphoribosyltransferase n=1 Tax=Terribacillus aidingensis TaxID=586416 RepID=A0A285N4E9_9BACI|nr:anthranilate phosphoribosyltransferase [Terribacillus aidingensis]SNZ04208.1 anthranilate phosphoribosyltransferase/anthranilate synthase/phosphoribosyltransferase [Terribacillus aidingensis]
MEPLLAKLTNTASLNYAEALHASRELLNGNMPDAVAGAFLSMLQTRGETADEVAGMVAAIREKAQTIPFQAVDVMDNCGTGGDGSQSFNISTTAAFVIAGAGITIAKHGNRSVSSRTGSADVLEKLGVPLSLPAAETTHLLKDNKIAFLFAPHVHPGLKQVMQLRKILRIPTIFNLIGPLTNPVPLDSQLLGIYRRDMLGMMAEALHKLGRKRAIVVNGAGHMDEASLAGDNHLVLLEEGKQTAFTLHPEEVGLSVYPLEAIKGGDAADNAQILLRVLNGEAGVHRDTVVLNAGLGIYANGKTNSIHKGIKMAQESIDSGAAKAKLQYLIDYKQKEVTS